MTYVARFTHDPVDDIQRGWSGWMGNDFKNPHDCAEFLGVEVEDGASDEDVLDALLHEQNTDLRFDQRLGVWRVFHHDGLSCFALEATTVERAMTEAQNGGFEWAGFGDRTLGNVRLIGPVEGVEDLFVFECDDVCPEN